MLGFVLGVEVVERAEELVESVRGRQVLVEITEVIFPELSCRVALGLEQPGDRDVARFETFFFSLVLTAD